MNLKFDPNGLIPAIVQDAASKRVLMMAWMNEQSIRMTIEKGMMCYWSRSRKKFWQKGETSGHIQRVREILYDCDQDTLLIKVDQTGLPAAPIGNEVEDGPANLWLRCHAAGGVVAAPLLGTRGVLVPQAGSSGYEARGTWQGLELRLHLRLAATEAAWCWHLQVENLAQQAQTIDLVHVQDIGLASYGAIRLNEHYVSHYLDLSPLDHPRHGCVLAARQNLAVDGRHPWTVIGSLRHGTAFATEKEMAELLTQVTVSGQHSGVDFLLFEPKSPTPRA